MNSNTEFFQNCSCLIINGHQCWFVGGQEWRSTITSWQLMILYQLNLVEPQPLVRASTDMPRQNKTSQSDKRISSYSIDYAQVLGVTALPKIPIQTLSADWMTEVKKWVFFALIRSEDAQSQKPA